MTNRMHIDEIGSPGANVMLFTIQKGALHTLVAKWSPGRYFLKSNLVSFLKFECFCE